MAGGTVPSDILKAWAVGNIPFEEKSSTIEIKTVSPLFKSLHLAYKGVFLRPSKSVQIKHLISWRCLSSGMLRRAVMYKSADVSEVLDAYMIRAIIMI